MTIRPARHADVFAIVEILVERQQDSRYNGIAQVDAPYARKLVSALIQRHGGTTDGAGFVMVAEASDGTLDAFVVGTLNRIYAIFDMLVAEDCFLLGRKNCPPRVLIRLFDEYVAWAAGNPKVLEIGASWNDTIPGGAQFHDVYSRKGFVERGRFYTRVNRYEGQEMAA